MRKTHSSLVALTLLCTLSMQTPAQQPKPSPAPTPAPRQQQPKQLPPAQNVPPAPDVPGDEDVVRITTNLVQLDAVVLDKRGKQVVSLKPEDFQVFEDGRPQKITNFSYVATEPEAAPAPDAAAAKPDKYAPPVPPRNLRPEQVRRTTALVVDDLGLSFESTATVRRALRDYVDKHVGANDLVAIVRTSAGAGALQQFTSDRRQLSAAIERVRWNGLGRGGISAFSPLQGNPIVGPTPRGGEDAKQFEKEFDDSREEYFAVGTLGALNFVIGGMRQLPGRKAVVLFSDGFSLYTPDNGRGRSDRVLIALRRLVDLANRAAVVFYTMDARGLVYTGLTAADNTAGMTTQEIGNVSSDRSQRLFDTQSGLQFLAEETGGFAVRNANDLPVRRIVEDQRGYYLIGYRPQTETFDRRFHTLSAKLVSHSDLRLRTRKGFYGVSDEQSRRARPTTPAQQISAALMSPFSSGGVRLRLTALFTNTPKDGSVIASMMHVDARDLEFKQGANGQQEAQVEIVGVTFTDTGRVIDQRAVSQTLRVRPDAFERIRRDGIVYTINVPVKKPGAYQLRVALRDGATEKIGSANQFVEVPDLRKNRLSLSGIVLNGEGAPVAAKGAAKTPGEGGGAAGRAAAGATEGEVETRDAQSSAAVRRFRLGTILDYACIVFNARADKMTARPQLTAQTRLFRDGQPVFSGKEQPVELFAQTDMKRIVYAGRLALGTALPPGDYVLQLVINDALADPKRRISTQWIDFEVVK